MISGVRRLVSRKSPCAMSSVASKTAIGSGNGSGGSGTVAVRSSSSRRILELAGRLDDRLAVV